VLRAGAEAAAGHAAAGVRDAAGVRHGREEGGAGRADRGADGRADRGARAPRPDRAAAPAAEVDAGVGAIGASTERPHGGTNACRLRAEAFAQAVTRRAPSLAPLSGRTAPGTPRPASPRRAWP